MQTGLTTSSLSLAGVRFFTPPTRCLPAASMIPLQIMEYLPVSLCLALEQTEYQVSHQAEPHARAFLLAPVHAPGREFSGAPRNQNHNHHQQSWRIPDLCPLSTQC